MPKSTCGKSDRWRDGHSQRRIRAHRPHMSTGGLKNPLQLFIYENPPYRWGRLLSKGVLQQFEGI